MIDKYPVLPSSEKSENAASFSRLGPFRISKQKSKMTGDCRVFKLLERSVEGKRLMRFQS